MIILLVVAQVLWAADDSVPYWKSDKEYYRKIKEEKKIAVSARAESIKEGKRLTITSAGWIKAPLQFTHDEVMNFDSYAGFLPYLVECKSGKNDNSLFVHGVLVGYHVKMKLRLTLIDESARHKIEWQVIDGNFMGMKGNIIEEDVGRERTEISMLAVYEGKTIPIPQFILDWLLEIAAHHAAAVMRTHIETDWTKRKNG